MLPPPADLEALSAYDKPITVKNPAAAGGGVCKFEGCPQQGPFVYYVTSNRNRGRSYNRWLRSAVLDAQQAKTVSPQCLCAVVGDFVEDHPMPYVPIAQAMEDWPYDKQVVELRGSFRRAGGLDAAMHVAVNNTPFDRSIVFFVDTDMIAFPGLLDVSDPLSVCASHLTCVAVAYCGCVCTVRSAL